MQVDLPTLEHFFAQAPFMVDLGVRPVAVQPGVVRTVLDVQPRHLQHTGVVHAGVMATMADHSMGAAAQTLAPEGHLILTAELKTSLLRGAAGTRLVCEARVIKAGRMLCFTEAEVWVSRQASDGVGGAAPDPERVLVMKASATMAVTPQR